MLRRTILAANILKPGYISIRKDREAARPKLIYIYKPPPKPEKFAHWDDMPSCALCHMRFMAKEEWAAHQESQLHKDRLRWKEQREWFNTTGVRKLKEKDLEDWEWYKKKVLIPKAEKEGVPVETLERQARRARTHRNASENPGADYPAIKAPLFDPKNVAWPMPRTPQ